MQNTRTNIDKKLKCKIDIANASKDEIIQYLCHTIHCEVERGKEIDCDLIRECSDWLDELTADEIIFTYEELKVRLEAIKRCHSINAFSMCIDANN